MPNIDWGKHYNEVVRLVKTGMPIPAAIKFACQSNTTDAFYRAISPEQRAELEKLRTHKSKK